MYNIKTIPFEEFCDFLDDQGYQGIDATPYISLGEYFIMGKCISEKVKAWEFIMTNYENDRFWIIRLDESDIDDVFEKYSSDILSFTGLTELEWKHQKLVNPFMCFFDCESYMGLLSEQKYGNCEYTMDEIAEKITKK